MARLVRIEFDPNVRVYGNGTYTSLDDIVDATIRLGDKVLLIESEEGIEVDAEVMMIDRDTNLVYYSVVWDSARRSQPEPVPVLVASSITTGRLPQRSFVPTAAFAFAGAAVAGGPR